MKAGTLRKNLDLDFWKHTWPLVSWPVLADKKNFHTPPYCPAVQTELQGFYIQIKGYTRTYSEYMHKYKGICYKYMNTNVYIYYVGKNYVQKKKHKKLHEN